MSIKKNILIFSNVIISPNEIRGNGNWIITLIYELIKNNERFNISVAFHDKKVKKIVFEDYKNLQLIRIPLYWKSNIVGILLNNWLIINQYKGATNNYLKIIDKINPDLIQIFGLESPFIRIINKVKQPIVIHIQGLLSSYIYKYKLRFSNFEVLRSNGFKNNLAGGIPWNEKRGWSRHLKIENEIYKNIEYCFGRTDWDRRCIKAIAPQVKYFYCQEIMRTQFYNSVWVPPKNLKYIFYTTIRDNFYKNVDIIYETCNILEIYNKKLAFEWRVGGINNEDITPCIMKRRKILPQNIKLLGTLNAEEIVDEMLNSNIFVYTSAIENGCNAVQEAMLLGIPIVTSYAGGVSSTIQDNETGVLVNEGDPYALAGAILELLENQDHAQKMGQKAREIALKRHDPQAVVKQVLDTYNIILNDNTK